MRGGKESAEEGEQSENAPQTNEAELQDLGVRLDKLADGEQEEIEVEVRTLYSEINCLDDKYHKKKFLSKLAAVAMGGLEEDLQNLLKQNGLPDSALQLVRDHTTRQIDLAKKLYQAKKYTTKQDELYMVLSERLLPKLETLGALVTNDIEVEGQNGWVEQLIKISPSLTRLRRMNYSDLDNLMKEATNGDRSVVENLFAEGTEIRKQCQRYGIGLKTAEKLERKGVESASDMSKEQLDEIIKEMPKGENPSTLKKMYFNESSERARERNVQDEKIKQIKKTMEDAKGLAGDARKITQEASEESKKNFQEKMKEIANKLSLPEGWDKQEKDDPNAHLEQLNREINIASDSLAITPYATNEDIAAAASGGLALYGILFDDHDLEGFSERPPLPLLKKPEYVEWLSPALGFQVRFFKSTEQHASTNFYKTAKSSGLSIAASVSGGVWRCPAGSSLFAFNRQRKKDFFTKHFTSTTHVTIIQCICQPTKAFRIPMEGMELNYEARSHAKEIKDKESGQRFLKMFGSHVPKGPQTLSGVFFRTLDVNTGREASASELMMAAGKQFDTEVSGFGSSVGGLGKLGYFQISGSSNASSTENVNCMSEMTVQALGPPTTNPEMFSQLLQSNNATWYVIDRGDRAALVPVWELMSDLKEQAEILKIVWKEIQEKRAVEKAEILEKENQEKRAKNCTYPFHPFHGERHSAKPKERLSIDLASEGVPEQANEIVIRTTIEVGPSPKFCWILILLFYRTVKLMVSTVSSSGGNKRKVRCKRARKACRCHSETISLPVACNGERVVRAEVKGRFLPFAKASLQLVGYYCNAALIEAGQEIPRNDGIELLEL
ncbi:uncharacterized protein [Montipora capricornis]